MSIQTHKALVRGFLFLLVVASLWLAGPINAQEDGPNRAGLVIVHGDGRVVTRCIAFAEAEITGLTLLQRSSVLWQSANGPMGAALCSLDGEGCPASDCFCECKGAPCAYWNYFHSAGDGSWLYAGVGAAVRMLKNGDVDGWLWGDGTAPPPALTFNQICGSLDAAPKAPSPTAIPAPSEEPVLPSATPGQTPEPTATALPTAAPTHTPTAKAAAMETASVTAAATAAVTPTPHPTSMPEGATATPLPPTANPEPAPTSTAEPTAVPGPATVEEAEGFFQTPLAQVGSFGLLVGVLVAFYFIQKRGR